ncbi:MAG: hypothetical protein ACI32P_05505 [Catenibacterium mitsuokai]
MKKVLKVILGILLSIIVVIGLLYGAFIYMIEYHVATVDKKSYNGYEVVMQSVGAPLFFSSADGRLLLKKNDTIINQTDFVLSDDGGSIRKKVWSVSWYKDHVGVVIRGTEQDDTLYNLYYNGKTNSSVVNGQDAITTKGDMAGNDADEIRKELKMVADYLHYDDIKYGISAKGWMYANLYNKDGVTRHLNYYETHEHEYVYQETKKGTTIVLGFYKIENGHVIDEHTTTWH